MRKVHLVLPLSLVLLVSPAFAAGDDAAAVARYCGAPSGESQGVSPVTSGMERDLIYGHMILHFQPSQAGWSFVSGWDRHLPQTEKMVERKMPCFAQAIAASVAEHPAFSTVDPTILSQTREAPAEAGSFGIPHLWLILALAALVAVIACMPGSRQRPFRASRLERPQSRRRPAMEGLLHRKRKTSVDV